VSMEEASKCLEGLCFKECDITYFVQGNVNDDVELLKATKIQFLEK